MRPPRGELAELQLSDAAFVGQVLEQREDARVMAVLEGFKGVTTGGTVEIALPRDPMSVPMPPAQPILGPVEPGPPVAVVANVRDDGRLAQGLCRFVALDGLRVAAAAARQGRRCGPPPRIVWAVPAVSGRALSLRVVVADDERRGATVRVEWGRFFGVRQRMPVTTKRVPRSRMLLLRHRYARSGTVHVQVTASSPATVPPSLCAAGAGSAKSRFLQVRIR